MLKRKVKNTGAGALPLPKPIPVRKRTSVLSLDFEGAVLHAAQGANGQVSGVARLPLEIPPGKTDDAPAVAAALKAALEAGKIRGKEVLFALPREQVVLRPLQVPMVADVRELASVVNFQIAKDLPFRVEDAIVDFKVLRAVEVARAPEGEAAPAGTERRLELLVGAVKKNTVEFYRAVARQAGLKLEGLGLRPLGNARFVAQAAGGPSAEGESAAAAMIVALRADETTIDVTEGARLVFSKVSGAPFPETAEGQSAFIQSLQIEAVRGLHSYGGAVSRIFVLGGTGLEPAVAEALAARLELPVEMPKGAGADADPAGTAAAGLALGAMDAGGLLLDFENPKRPPVQRNTKRTRILAAAAAALVLLIAVVAVRMNLIKKRLAVKQQVQTELSEAEKKLPIYRRLKAQQKIVAAWTAEEQPWLDHLAYLSGVLPGADQIYLSAFATTPQHVIRFSVQSKTGELLAELDKTLRAAGYEVKPLSITPASDKHGYHFRTTVELSIPRKMKPGLDKVKAPPRPADDSPARADAKGGKDERRSS